MCFSCTFIGIINPAKICALEGVASSAPGKTFSCEKLINGKQHNAKIMIDRFIIKVVGSNFL